MDAKPRAVVPTRESRNTGSLRAGALVACLMLLLSLALVGPNRIQDICLSDWTSGPVAAADDAGFHSSNYIEAANLSETPLAEVAPRLPDVGSEGIYQKSLHSDVALTGHVAETPSPTPNLAFRESVSEEEDRMRAIQHRLQLLGARYMLLESWGDVAPKYRFLCHVPDRRGEVVKYEFVSDDPLYAMQRVLYQVEQRIAGR